MWDGGEDMRQFLTILYGSKEEIPGWTQKYDVLVHSMLHPENDETQFTQITKFHLIPGINWCGWFDWQQPGHFLVQQEEDPEELPPVDAHPGYL